MQLTLSKAPVSALLDARGCIHTCGGLTDPSLADNENRVRVLFGTEKLSEEFEVEVEVEVEEGLLSLEEVEEEMHNSNYRL